MTKKGCLGKGSDLDTEKGRKYTSPDLRQEGSRAGESSILTFSLGPQKVSKKESEMSQT